MKWRTKNQTKAQYVAEIDVQNKQHFFQCGAIHTAEIVCGQLTTLLMQGVARSYQIEYRD